MSGIKGRSGRKKWSEEEKIHQMRRKSIEITTKFISDESQSLSERAKIAAPLAAKELTNKTEVSIDKITIEDKREDKTL